MLKTFAAGGLGENVNSSALLALLARDGASDPWIRQACIRALERLRTKFVDNGERYHPRASDRWPTLRARAGL